MQAESRETATLFGRRESASPHEHCERIRVAREACNDCASCRKKKGGKNVAIL